MTRFNDLASEYRRVMEEMDKWGWSGDETLGEFRAKLKEIEMRMHNQDAQEIAEHHAYKICGACGRIYSRAQWGRLAESPAGLRRKDNRELSEWRICETCETPLGLILQVYAGQPFPNARRIEELAHEEISCSACLKDLKVGETVVTRVSRSAGLQGPVRQTVCIDCENVILLSEQLECK